MTLRPYRNLRSREACVFASILGFSVLKVSQSPKPVEECLAIWKCLVSETLAASMIVRSSRSSSALFFPLVQRLRTCRRIQLLLLLHSTGRKSGCFKLTSVEVTTKPGRKSPLIFNFSSSQGEFPIDIGHRLKVLILSAQSAGRTSQVRTSPTDGTGDTPGFCAP